MIKKKNYSISANCIYGFESGLLTEECGSKSWPIILKVAEVVGGVASGVAIGQVIYSCLAKPAVSDWNQGTKKETASGAVLDCCSYIAKSGGRCDKSAYIDCAKIN